jgi:hypothetical protein
LHSCPYSVGNLRGSFGIELVLDTPGKERLAGMAPVGA